MVEIEKNDGTQDIGEEVAYMVDMRAPVCPCCGKRLKVITNTSIEEDEPLELTMENLNENMLSDYLLDICAQEAMNIYDNEIGSHEPDVDIHGNISQEYNERFKYTDNNLKKVIKVKSNAIANKLAKDGINVNPFYIENEIVEMLKCIH